MDVTLTACIKGTITIPTYQPVAYASSLPGGFSNILIGGDTDSHWRALRYIQLSNVKQGDILVISAKGQTKNAYGSVEHELMLTADTVGLALTYDDETALAYGIPRDYLSNSAYAQGVDIQHDDNHYFNWIVPAVVYVIPADATQLQLIVWLRARYSAADGTQNIVVQTDQQWLHVIKFPKN